jgi:hypothetical protein
MPYLSPLEADISSWLMIMRRRLPSNLRPILLASYYPSRDGPLGASRLHMFGSQWLAMY